jgi:hypothetical protein
LRQQADATALDCLRLPVAICGDSYALRWSSHAQLHYDLSWSTVAMCPAMCSIGVAADTDRERKPEGHNTMSSLALLPANEFTPAAPLLVMAQPTAADLELCAVIASKLPSKRKPAKRSKR